jgi:molybdopterin-guanine dinucleotide biosynthesis protein A
MPLIKSSVFEYLYSHIFGYDCCIPINEENHNVEPLCSVYNVKRSIEASFLAIEDGKVGPKHFVSYLSRVNYVPISKIRAIDPNLDSIVNINYPREYEELLLLQRSRNEQKGDACTSQAVPMEPFIFSHHVEDSFERTQKID